MRILSVVLIFVGLLNASCSTSQTEISGKIQLSPQEFLKAIKDQSDIKILDVRTPLEYSEGHIEGALNYDVKDENFASDLENLNKTKPVYVYCLSGGRSSRAVEILQSQGFKQIYELQGGIMKWRNENLPLSNRITVKGMSLDQYKELVNSDKLVLVDFYADWCGPCKKMKPFLEEIEKEKKDEVIVIRIDADKNPELMRDLKVEALPELKLYDQGKLIWNHIGFLSKQEIEVNL